MFANTFIIVKLRTIYHAWDLWNLARSCKQLCLLFPLNLQNLPGTVVLGALKSPSETVLSKYISICIK